ncbi:Yma [Agrobacterium tumefaciens str. B6]|uniref:Yma n=3 Tax=Rhizobiaceae TaxID=82115 RepID=O52290_AGRTU|nr:MULTISPECIES: hypothetical protein [Agrobacterium]KWT81865.1 hypothetical protein ASB65_12845 [Agrobacterium tumefaciens str. B6]CUX06668.1 Yma [Agrobacterium fabacearum TT111]AAB91575.2 yma [Agrobacterium tumefaciens]ASK41606.1 hypothetical protein [Agrobacterium tumefaciens]ASK42759.1 hypothetical protein [Agrobacterium sp.]
MRPTGAQADELRTHEVGMVDGLGFHLDDRDYAHYLIADLDLEAQLIAIRAIIARNAAAAKDASDQIDKMAEWARQSKGRVSDHATDLWVDEMHASVYSDAAASMAALGMFAPLIESIFTHTFRALHRMYRSSETPFPAHERWTRLPEEMIDRWSANIYVDVEAARTDLPAGIKQLSHAVGLSKFITKSDFRLVNALLNYRNRMFHMGFEWPLEDRQKFEKLVNQNRWETFFTSSRHGNEPWIFYLTDSTVDGLPDWVDELITKIGLFARSLPRDLLSGSVE